MELTNSSNGLEVKVSKAGSLIPCLNGVHLHSMYNPQKEALEFVEKHRQSLMKRNNVLVLGLGFGYHIFEIMNVLTEYHGNNFCIAVIEPSNEIVEKCREINSFINQSQINIYCNTNLEDLYNNQELIDFLTKTPVVIAHPASFNLFQEYYKSYLSYRASTAIDEIKNKTKNITIHDYLDEQSRDLDIEQFTLQLKHKSRLSSMDHFFLAFEKLTEQSKSR